MEVPSMLMGHLETPSPLNAEGFKGLGEGGAMPVPAVIANAVADALLPFGVRVGDLPLTPPRILALIEAARSKA
jgi:CO/xanthine dehydrogenase Mo-binding subunit